MISEGWGWGQESGGGVGVPGTWAMRPMHGCPSLTMALRTRSHCVRFVWRAQGRGFGVEADFGGEKTKDAKGIM